MNKINTFNPGSGRSMRDDETVINVNNYIAPAPNGDEIIEVAEAGVKTLTVPVGTIAAEIPYAPVDLFVRYGDNTPALNAGAYYPEGSTILFDSPEKTNTVNIYATAVCSLFVQYYK